MKRSLVILLFLACEVMVNAGIRVRVNVHRPCYGEKVITRTYTQDLTDCKTYLWQMPGTRVTTRFSGPDITVRVEVLEKDTTWHTVHEETFDLPTDACSFTSRFSSDESDIEVVMSAIPASECSNKFGPTTCSYRIPLE